MLESFEREASTMRAMACNSLSLCTLNCRIWASNRSGLGRASSLGLGVPIAGERNGVAIVRCRPLMGVPLASVTGLVRLCVIGLHYCTCDFTKEEPY
jgi:hypothetical protein